MKREDVTTYKNKEYVTVREFAKRVESGERTIRTRIAEGKIPTTKFDHRPTQYIEWETGKSIWMMLPHDKKKSSAGKISSSVKKYGKEPKGTLEPKVNAPTVAAPTEDIEIQDIVDFSAFSKEQYADCVLPNGEFDYDKLKIRLTAETYAQKLQKERGQLVEKSEIVNWAKKLGILVNTGLESIPQKYTSVLIAQCQGIIARREGMPAFEFTEKERTDIRTALKDCGPEIMRSVKLMIMEMEE